MELEAAIVFILGVIYLGTGLGFAYDPRRYKEIMEAYAEDGALRMLTGMILLTLGCSLLMLIEYAPRAIETLAYVIAILCAIKGLVFLALPRWAGVATARFSEKMNFQMLGAVLILLGLALGLIAVWNV